MIRNLTITRRISIALVLVAVALCAVISLGRGELMAVVDRLAVVVDVRYPSTMAAVALKSEIDAASRGLNGALAPEVAASPEDWNTMYRTVQDSVARAQAVRKRWAEIPHATDDRARWDAIQQPYEAWILSIRESLDAVRAWRSVSLSLPANDPTVTGYRTRAVAQWRKTWRAYAALAEPLDADIQRISEQTATDKAAAVDSSRRATTRNLVLGLLALAGTAVAALVLSRNIHRTVKRLVREAERLTRAVAQGRLGERGELAAVGREFRPVIQAMNETMDALARPVEVTAEYVTRIAAGQIPPRIEDEYQGDFNRIKDALNRCIDSLTGLIAEMGRMAGEHERGEIDATVEVERFAGAYRTMAQGVNAMVGAHVAANRDAMAVFAEFGRGNFAANLEPLPGKKRLVNDTIDRVRQNLQELIAELNRVSSEQDAGDLDAVIDVERFQGDYRRMAEGVNEMVAGHIAVKRKAMACVAEFGRGNFEAPLEPFPGKKAFINETVEQVRANLKALIADADALMQAAVAGRLTTRADPSRHQGDFRKIVEGFNRTLDAVIVPIHESAGVLERLAERDLRARVQGAYQGEHARMKESVNATARALHDALVQVSRAVEQVSSAATQIAASSQSVASGASQQAATLGETTSAVDSVSSTTTRTAESAQQADALAQSARTSAAVGSAAVEQMQGAMTRIRSSAEGTSQIIRDINDIAFQTNLLALNAAVEAARAGEAGRGFAVVAEEVRSLALRVKEAARRTEELIRRSIHEAGEGESTARRVASTLSEIAGGISKVTDLVTEIAAGARVQAGGIAQVTTAIGEMDKLMQQNAASAEESASAASELSAQAEELAAMVSAFQLEARAVEAPAARPERWDALPVPEIEDPFPVASTGGPSDGAAEALAQLATSSASPASLPGPRAGPAGSA